jgi:outer membrane lipoprotein carrier protein
MKQLVVLLSILFSFSSVVAQEYKSCENSAYCKKFIKDKQASTSTISADFTESSYSSMLKEAQKSSGELWFKQPGKIRFEHVSPKKTVLLINNQSIKYFDNGKEIKNVAALKVIRKIQDLMVKMFSGAFFESKEFTLSYYENATNYKINLTPKNKRMTKYISVIQLVFSKKDGTLKELTIKENETDKLVYTFSNIQLNKTILDIKFSTL